MNRGMGSDGKEENPGLQGLEALEAAAPWWLERLGLHPGTPGSPEHPTASFSFPEGLTSVLSEDLTSVISKGLTSFSLGDFTPSCRSSGSEKKPSSQHDKNNDDGTGFTEKTQEKNHEKIVM